VCIQCPKIETKSVESNQLKEKIIQAQYSQEKTHTKFHQLKVTKEKSEWVRNNLDKSKPMMKSSSKEITRIWSGFNFRWVELIIQNFISLCMGQQAQSSKETQSRNIF
jgi:hypothetical protein